MDENYGLLVLLIFWLCANPKIFGLEMKKTFAFYCGCIVGRNLVGCNLRKSVRSAETLQIFIRTHTNIKLIAVILSFAASQETCGESAE